MWFAADFIAAVRPLFALNCAPMLTSSSSARRFGADFRGEMVDDDQSNYGDDGSIEGDDRGFGGGGTVVGSPGGSTQPSEDAAAAGAAGGGAVESEVVRTHLRTHLRTHPYIYIWAGGLVISALW
eukprot:GHVU01061072.1.p1 GENE.GHVU01061072.1~~GHVU01061072.1.p1  ORF type:complete len:125 (-),score=20.90 GHVU01061072.1:88-462(-)